MNLETASPADVGRSLQGIGLNLLTRDVPGLAGFLTRCFGLSIHRQSADFAIVAHGGMLLQLHHDSTFASHPLHGLLPESGLRAGGVQIYLFGVDPDEATTRAADAGGHVVEPARTKPHGLREATILAPEGQAFSPAVRIWA